MAKVKRYSAYDDFAWVYNKHWGDMFTDTARAVFEKLVQPKIPPKARILDLCCGTGQLAKVLADRGYRVTGLDGSKEMLKFARERAPDVPFILDDARTFKVKEKFDAVISVFDSLNHIMTIEELGRVFANVFNCLQDDGWFLFDMNMEEGYRKNWEGYYGIVEADHVCIFPNRYDVKKRIGQIDFTIFRLDGNWRRADFKLTQKCYTEKEIRSALSEAGFASIVAYSSNMVNWALELTALTKKSKRAFFLGRKK